MAGRKETAVSVVIVNYNAGRYLLEAVQSVLTQSRVGLEVIIVDNASTDGSLEPVRALQDGFRKIAIIEVEYNSGFAHGCNLGLAHATGKHVLFLNPDCVLSANSISRLSRFLEKNPEACMVGPLILGPDGREQAGCRRDIPSPFQVGCVLLGIHRLLPNHPRFRHFNHTERPLPKGATVVQAVSGACMMVRTADLRKYGAFDESYFLHFEDIDLCLRLTQDGRDIYFLPTVEVLHHKGISSQHRPVFVNWHKHRSLIRFFRKNFWEFYPKAVMASLSAIIYLHFVMTAPLSLLPRRRRSGVSGWDILTDGTID